MLLSRTVCSQTFHLWNYFSKYLCSLTLVTCCILGIIVIYLQKNWAVVVVSHRKYPFLWNVMLLKQTTFLVYWTFWTQTMGFSIKPKLFWLHICNTLRKISKTFLRGKRSVKSWSTQELNYVRQYFRSFSWDNVHRTCATFLYIQNATINTVSQIKY